MSVEGPRDLVTGATGMLGSHIAERLVARGRRVRALVRPASDTRFLRSLGVELVVGDLTETARLVDRLRHRRVLLIGRGDNPLSAVYAGIVADAAILAAGDPGSVGEAYNITNQGPITQRAFMNLLAEAAGAPPVRRRV